MDFFQVLLQITSLLEDTMALPTNILSDVTWTWNSKFASATFTSKIVFLLCTKDRSQSFSISLKYNIHLKRDIDLQTSSKNKYLRGLCLRREDTNTDALFAENMIYLHNLHKLLWRHRTRFAPGFRRRSLPPVFPRRMGTATRRLIRSMIGSSTLLPDIIM